MDLMTFITRQENHFELHLNTYKKQIVVMLDKIRTLLSVRNICISVFWTIIKQDFKTLSSTVESHETARKTIIKVTWDNNDLTKWAKNYNNWYLICTSTCK